MFGERPLSISSLSEWPPSWTFKAKEGWEEKEISTKGVVYRREEGEGSQGEKYACQ